MLTIPVHLFFCFRCRHSTDSFSISPVLRKTTSFVVPNSECRSVYGSIIDATIICTSVEAGSGTCNVRTHRISDSLDKPIPIHVLVIIERTKSNLALIVCFFCPFCTDRATAVAL